jgi:hypothetical protein
MTLHVCPFVHISFVPIYLQRMAPATLILSGVYLHEARSCTRWYVHVYTEVPLRDIVICVSNVMIFPRYDVFVSKHLIILREI